MPDALPVLYQDDTLVVINKPSGLLVHRLAVSLLLPGSLESR